MEELNQAIMETEIKKETKEAGEASKKPIELKIEQTNKEIADLEKSLKAKKKIAAIVKLQCPAGKATPAPPVYRDWETKR